MVNTRTLIPHVVHEAIGFLGAISTAPACLVPGAVAEGIASINAHQDNYSVEHPSGEFTVKLENRIEYGKLTILKSGVIRTARLISKGDLFLPDNG